MKKWICLVLVLTLVTAMVACTAAEPTETKPVETTVPGPVDDIELQQVLYLLDDMSGLNLASFCRQQEVTAESIAWTIGAEEFGLPFEAGLALEPMMNVDPFVLAVFRLPEGADGAAFAEALKEKANVNKWVCVSAQTVEVVCRGRTVLFVMGGTVQPLLDAFDKMCQPGFRAEDHLKDRLAGKTMEELYAELCAQYGVEHNGFLDGTEYGPVHAETPYGLSGLASELVVDSLVDEGYVPADEFDGERSYLLVMLRLIPDVDVGAFADVLRQNVDISALKGGDVQSVTAWGGDTVVFFAGAGSLAWSTAQMEQVFSGVYRMEPLE